jgi:hypothetical protein
VKKKSFSMNNQEAKKGRRSRTVIFIAVQVVVLAVVVGVTLAKLVREKRARSGLPAVRRVPHEVPPLYDRPDVVSDEDVLTVLWKLRPRLQGDNPKINHVDHALRFWGVEAAFRDPECLSGAEMRQILLDHAKFKEVWGEDTEPFLQYHEEEGVHVRTKEGNATASHDDHTLASLAEVGTPLDFKIKTDAGEVDFYTVLKASLRVFNLNQVEYEWSTLAYTLYLDSPEPWTAQNGQVITFDRLADRIMRERLKLGVCYGNHRLHTLVMMLRVDDDQPILTPECRVRVVEYLQEVTSVLVESQDPAGFWNQYWATGIAPVPDDAHEHAQVGAQGRRLLATGHALEWWALAPEEILPPPEVVQRAGEWMVQEVISMDDEAIRDNYTFLTHVGRAVALWRGHFPDHFIEAMEREHN